MIVTKSGWSPATNAYRSVLSTDGSAEISGASRWLEATEEPGTRTSTAAINNVAPAAASTPLVRRRRVSGGASAMPAPSQLAHARGLQGGIRTNWQWRSTLSHYSGDIGSNGLAFSSIRPSFTPVVFLVPGR